MRVSPAVLLVFLALLIPRAAHAQFRDQLYPGAWTAQVVAPVDGVLPSVAALDGEWAGRRSTPALVVGGVLGGGVGMIAGMLAGGLMDGPPDEDCIDFCFGPGLILGILGGEALGIAAGVHLANGRDGSLPIGMLTSAGILVLGLLAAQDAPSLILALPIAQITGAVTAERRTERRR